MLDQVGWSVPGVSQECPTSLGRSQNGGEVQILNEFKGFLSLFLPLFITMSYMSY